jgi:hypothetical protein
MTLTMHANIRDELVKRLRSGDYQQGKEKLAIKDDDGEHYCCLGVLCQMAVEAGVTKRTDLDESYWEEVDGDDVEVQAVAPKYGGTYDVTLPPEVALWAGIIDEGTAASMQEPGVEATFSDNEGLGRFGERVPGKPTVNTLAGLNDDGVPFTEIADFIEQNAVTR